MPSSRILIASALPLSLSRILASSIPPLPSQMGGDKNRQQQLTGVPMQLIPPLYRCLGVLLGTLMSGCIQMGPSKTQTRP